MKRLRRKLRSRRGLTLVEMVAAAAVLALLALLLHSGLFMAQNSYIKMTGEAERQLLLSTLTDLLSNEFRYARDVEVGAGNTLQHYTSLSYGRNVFLEINDDGQLAANGKPMLSTGAYGNGDYQVDVCTIAYTDGIFQVTLNVSGRGGSDETNFSVRCLNGRSGEGGST